MPIEFKCQSCARTLRVPDGSEGRQCQCPGCSAIVSIPTTFKEVSSSRETQPAAPAAPVNHVAQAPAEVDKANDPSDKISVACPNCSQPLLCERNLIGTKGQCKGCQCVFLISLDPRQVQASVATTEMTFACPQCGQLFDGQPHMQGRRGRCHVCQAVFSIQLQRKSPQSPVAQPPKIETPRQPAVATASELNRTLVESPPDKRLPISPRNNDTRPPSRPLTPIQFACGACKGVMEVPGDTIGQSTVCPYCMAVSVIPPVSQQPNAPRAQTSKPGGWSAVGSPLDQLPDLSAELPAGQRVGPQVFASDDPFSITPQANSSLVAIRRSPKKTSRRGLTFTNAYGLFFESFVPACFISSVLWVIILALPYGLFLLSSLLSVAIGSIHPVLGVGAFLLAIISIVIFVPLSNLYLVAITQNAALEATRGAACNSASLFGGARIMLPLLGFVGLVFLIMLIPCIIAGLAIYAAKLFAATSTAVAVACLIVYLVSILATTYIQMTYMFTPFALLDGQRVVEAMATSSEIFRAHSLTIFSVFLTFFLLLTLTFFVTLGLGALLLFASFFYMAAAMYELGRK